MTWALIVMPFSRSRSILSRTWACIWREVSVPVNSKSRSASVLFPWSICAIMQKLRMFSIPVSVPQMWTAKVGIYWPDVAKNAGRPRIFDRHCRSLVGHKSVSWKLNQHRRFVGYLLFIDDPILHDEGHLLKHTNILQRVSVNGDDVCKIASLYGAELVRHTQNPGICDRRRQDRIDRRHSRFHHVAELPGVFSVRKYSGVSSECDPHAALVSFAE